MSAPRRARTMRSRRASTRTLGRPWPRAGSAGSALARVVAVAVVLVAGGVAGGCAPEVPPVTPGPDRPALTLSPTDIQSIAIVLRLEDHRVYEPETFARLQAGGSEEVRRRVVTAAGRIGDTAALPLLLDALAGDPSPAVRADAAFALGELGDTSAAVVRALGEAVSGDWTPVRPAQTTLVVEVLGALGKLGTEDGRGLVAAALRDAIPARDESSRHVAAEALLAIWKFDRAPGHLGPASRYLDSPDAELRWRAAYALARGGDPQASTLLLPRLGDDDPRVRALAARGLTGPRTDSAGVADSARAALLERLGDDHPHVRINALRALATFADTGGATVPVDAIVGALRDPSSQVAVAAADALGALGDAARAPLTTAATDPGLPLAVRSAAAARLAAVGDEGAAAAIALADRWAAGPADERYHAARLLPAIGWERGGELLGRLAADRDPRVAVAALAAAEAVAGDSALPAGTREALREILLPGTRAADPRVRTVALRALVPILAADDVDAVLDAYAAAVEDSAGRPAAIAALTALGALEQRDSVGAPAAFFLRFNTPADRWVARAVAESLRPEAPPAADSLDPRVAVGDTAPAVAPEDPEYYRRIVRDYIARPLATGERPEARIRTGGREIVLELLADEAPLTVHNFVTLAAAGYFDLGVWHRVVPNFVLQDGAPAGDPSGGPGWSIRDEINRVRYDRGVLGMALSGPDTGGSQWFITHSPQPHLDGGYTVFGRVVDGMDTADRVLQGDAIAAITIRW